MTPAGGRRVLAATTHLPGVAIFCEDRCNHRARESLPMYIGGNLSASPTQPAHFSAAWFLPRNTGSMSIEPIAVTTAGNDGGLIVVYDGECPFCRNYMRLMALRRAAGPVELVDARTPAPAVNELVQLGYDLNEGMIAVFGRSIYYGTDAVVLLSSLASERGWVGRLVAFLLRNPRRARLLYPIMKLGRRIVLKSLGIPLI
jgi:predicted DCC family thiol-disulfide oxidoreductase YuxK